MGRPTKIVIDLNALRHNFQQVKKHAPHSAILAMVKSNGYGHGMELVALALPEADALGVACIEEGLHLRQAGVSNPIVLIEGLFTGDELSHVVNENFTLVIHHEAQVQLLEMNPHLPPISIWLKMNTGMNRLGFAPQDVASIYQRLLACPAVKKPFGLMSHFACADATDRSHASQQIAVFDKITAGLSGPKSLCNSAGILSWPEAHRDWVRPGLMLYGASPFLEKEAEDLNLRPVMSFESELIAVHSVAKDERVGYGGTWTSLGPSRIGVVAAGYGDGYPQYARNGTPVLVNGKICPLAGRVSMDMLTVDLSEQLDAKVGDPVVLWGNGLSVSDVAKDNHTSAYELLTRITQRVKAQVVAATA